MTQTRQKFAKGSEKNNVSEDLGNDRPQNMTVLLDTLGCIFTYHICFLCGQSFPRMPELSAENKESWTKSCSTS